MIIKDLMEKNPAAGSDLRNIKEKNIDAMQRHVIFWKRQMPDGILIDFGAEDDATLDAVKTEGVVSQDWPPLYDNIPKMLMDFEKSIEITYLLEKCKVKDDSIQIPVAWPELQFGNGMGGAIFGATLVTTGTEDHTYTFNEPLITDWLQVYDLKFDRNNEWVRRILDTLEYFIKNSSKDFAVRPFFIYEGLDFIVSMRGTTKAFYDVADRPEQLSKLYDIGREAGIKFFEMKKAVVQEHNEKVINFKEYSEMAPLHSVPMLDMDAYALCPPKTFKDYGFENKQKILDHFKGGSFYIHALGRHIISTAAQLNNLTELWLFDDPKCPGYFGDRIHWRNITYDIPLQMYCGLGEFIKALDERTLPGGVKYNIFTSGKKFGIEDKNSLVKKVRGYKTDKLSAVPKN